MTNLGLYLIVWRICITQRRFYGFVILGQWITLIVQITGQLSDIVELTIKNEPLGCITLLFWKVRFHSLFTKSLTHEPAKNICTLFFLSKTNYQDIWLLRPWTAYLKISMVYLSKNKVFHWTSSIMNSLHFLKYLG